MSCVIQVAETEYNVMGFIYLGILAAVFIFLSVRHMRKSKEIYKSREARNREKSEHQ